MKKADVVNLMAEKSGLSRTDAGNALQAFFDVITESLEEEDKIVLIGYLTLEKTYRKATRATNPRTGEPVDVAERFGLKIKAGKLLLDAVQKKRADV